METPKPPKNLEKILNFFSNLSIERQVKCVNHLIDGLAHSKDRESAFLNHCKTYCWIKDLKRYQKKLITYHLNMIRDNKNYAKKKCSFVSITQIIIS